jgi:hypothetical protein
MTNNDSGFVGSIPDLYDRNIGPLMMMPYAGDRPPRQQHGRRRIIVAKFCRSDGDRNGERAMNVYSMLLAILCGLLCGSPLRASAATPFDGAWDTGVYCPRVPDGAGPYSWHFISQITNGAITAQYGEMGKPQSGSLTRNVNSDGSGIFSMDGLSGDAGYSLGNAPAETPYHYSITVHFNGSVGTGQRNEGRPCQFSFSRM